MRHQPGERVWRVYDIGVGQKQIVRPQLLGGGNALLQGPQLSRPSARRAAVHDHSHVTVGVGVRGAHRRRRGSVAAIVIDNNGRKSS
jgi:hypothetical protein